MPAEDVLDPLGALDARPIIDLSAVRARQRDAVLASEKDDDVKDALAGKESDIKDSDVKDGGTKESDKEEGDKEGDVKDALAGKESDIKDSDVKDGGTKETDKEEGDKEGDVIDTLQDPDVVAAWSRVSSAGPIM
jgi:hypothetical protein